MSNILEVKDLSVSYGGIKAVKNISFQVPEGGDRNPDRSQRCRQKLHPAFYCRSGKAKDRQHQIKWK